MVKPKSIEGLDCDGVAADGISLVLMSRFNEMHKHHDAALSVTDIEGVHDMRVASRRLRSVLEDFEPYLRRRPLSRCVDEIKQIAGALGVVRDLDVGILALERLLANSPADVANGIESFTAERRQRRELALEDLTKVIEGEQLQELNGRFQKAVRKALEPGKSRKRAGLGSAPSLSSISFEIVANRAEELLGLGSSVFFPFKRKQLHHLRKGARSLRYVLELFTICLPSQTAALADPLARLQRALGDLHDTDLYIDEIGNRLFDQSEGANGYFYSTEHSHEIWLLRAFSNLRAKHYSDALEEWEQLQPRLLHALAPPLQVHQPS